MKVYFKQAPFKPKTYLWQRFVSLLPTVMIVVGASLLISVGYPIINYELTVVIKSRQKGILSPVPREALSAPVQAESNYTKLSSWFSFSRPQEFLSPTAITHYTISIPKLRIKEAVVTIGGDELGKSLIHYGGTANPGQPGNTVIFGHSILPQFYNPSSYKSIFSLIPTLKPGDHISVNFDGITYKYVVYEYIEALPSEIDILEQNYSRKDLSLVTCVPPGTYLRRGIVHARLVEI